MYRILNYLFGWDYILWKNCLYSGISRVRRLPNGDVYFLTYGKSSLLNNITTGKGNGEVVQEWLTCLKSKYIFCEPEFAQEHLKSEKSNCKCGLPKKESGIGFSCIRTDCDANITS